MKPIQQIFVCAALIVTVSSSTRAFAAQASSEGLDAVQALQIYPADVRAATAKVLQHPEVLVELEKYRQVARTQFKELIAPYPEKTQETVRQLVPYRKLWRSLGTYQGNEAATQNLLKSYPKDVQDRANYLIKNSPDTIGKVANLEKQTYQHFHQMLSGLDPQAREAFQRVGQHSGIFSILSTALNLRAETGASPELKQKSQNLANQLLALNKEGKTAVLNSNVDPSDANAVLDSASKKFKEDLNRQMDQDPYTEGAVQATVSFSPNPYYSNYLGNRPYPYWY